MELNNAANQNVETNDVSLAGSNNLVAKKGIKNSTSRIDSKSGSKVIFLKSLINRLANISNAIKTAFHKTPKQVLQDKIREENIREGK